LIGCRRIQEIFKEGKTSMVKEQLKAVFVVMGFVAIGLFFSTSVFASEITSNLKATIDKVIEIVTDENLKSQQQARREKLRETIGKRFNYNQMVIRSLAKDWNNRTPRERKDFEELFKRLLENSYASKIESYSDEKINYVDEVVKGKYALVKTEIVRKDATIQVDYKMIQNDGEWKVYDFLIEGVSLIRNYRSQFTKIIRKESFDALVQKLSAKIEEIEATNQKSNSENL
jgi:phospholipid transport system substrate-binding protein